MTGTSLMKEQWLCTNQGNKITKTLLQPNMEGWNEIALPTVKFKFRQSGGGRKVIAPALNSIAWLLYRCCVSMKARLPRSLFKSQAKFFYDQWRDQQPDNEKQQTELVGWSKWIKEWTCEYNVSLRKPNRRY